MAHVHVGIYEVFSNFCYRVPLKSGKTDINPSLYLNRVRCIFGDFSLCP